MAITITIDGTDFTSALLVDESFNVADVLNSRNTARFTLRQRSGAYLLVGSDGSYLVGSDGSYIGSGVRPAIGSEVIILNGATTIFGGTIEGFTETQLAMPSPALIWDIECVDFNSLADRRLVAELYETPGQTLGDIVRDIVTNYLTGFGVTDTLVQDGPTLDRAVFNYQSVAEAFNDLAELTGYSWNIDYDKVLHFFARETNYAPYDLTETSSNWRGMTVSRTRGAYRNRQFVRAGTDQTDTLVATLAGDGARKVFTLAYPVATEPTITVGGVSKTIGIRGLESGFDLYWQKGSTEISQDDGAAAVTDGVAIVVTYTGMLPILLMIQDDAEVAGSGVWEAIEDRPTVDKADLAEGLALGLLRKLGRLPITLEWETDTDGLEAGQLVTVTVPTHDLSGRYLIESVTIADLFGQHLRYRVKALDGEALGGWEDFFRGLLRLGRKFTIRENEVILLVRSFAETVTLTDSATYATATAAASKWVVGTSAIGFCEVS